eukprot:TRINITY_DN38187_c0_g1_i1.p4 TRINITY_DN38187_c0_g1~~TRINITY_DN38187_c0_g1_i1.p4  ORF type:complete len:108 (+),score=3.07 TRINITY_DN38187_c0_g1_i1:657-980(+)
MVTTSLLPQPVALPARLDVRPALAALSVSLASQGIYSLVLRALLVLLLILLAPVIPDISSPLELAQPASRVAPYALTPLLALNVCQTTILKMDCAKQATAIALWAME